MDELIRQALTVLRGMWKHKWIGLATAWGLGAVATVVVLRIPDKYEASARIYVDTQSILKPLMSGLAVEPNLDQQIRILSRTLISRPNVEKLVRMSDLDLKVKTKAEQEALVENLQKALRIESTGKDNLYTLAYRDTEPDNAKKVVQALVTIFVESGLRDKRQDTDSARKFIEDQISVYQKKLEEAEGRLKEFKLKHIGLQTAEGKDYFGRIGEVSQALSQAKLDLREAENSRDALKRQIVGEDPNLLPDSKDTSAGISVPEIDGRIDALQRNLDGLLQRFTDKHPDVVGTRRMIKELQEQKIAEIAARKKSGLSGPASLSNTNPVYQQIKVSLAETEATVASLRARVAEYQARYDALTASAKMVPEVEAEFAQLNRDYDINKKNYESLVARRESATISGDMDSTAGGINFQLVDPPRVSSKPVEPNRFLILPFAFVISLGLGFAVAFAGGQLRPVFFDSRGLRELSGLPLLGAVSFRQREVYRERTRKDLRKFIGAVMGMLLTYCIGFGLLFVFSAS